MTATTLTARTTATLIPANSLVYRAGRGFERLTEVEDHHCGHYLVWADGTREWRVGNGQMTVAVFGPVTATWCDECGHDTAADEYGRTWPYAVYLRGDSGREYATRNHSHASAHALAERARAEGRQAHISLDACG